MIVGNDCGRFSTEYDSRLVEEAVLLAIAGRAEERRFRSRRDRIYELQDAHERDQAFHQFHAAWFSRLRLGDPVATALNEQPLLSRQTDRCRIIPAMAQKDEGADLHIGSDFASESCDPLRTIMIRLRPATLLRSAACLSLLRHELMHLADMLSPGFGYKPELPKSEAGPAYDNLLRERYRVLWDATIDGRLVQRGWLPAEARLKRLAEFATAFPELQAAFPQWFDTPDHRHAELLAFAEAPTSGDSAPLQPQARKGRCPLCRFPSFHLIDGLELSADELDEVFHDFPNWDPNHGLCRQCADLYRARHTSRLAAESLPGIF